MEDEKFDKLRKRAEELSEWLIEHQPAYDRITTCYASAVEGKIPYQDVMWAYRVVLKGGHYAIHEVYYNEGGGLVTLTEEPVYPTGRDIEDWYSDMLYYFEACGEPVLNYDELCHQAKGFPVADRLGLWPLPLV